MNSAHPDVLIYENGRLFLLIYITKYISYFHDDGRTSRESYVFFAADRTTSSPHLPVKAHACFLPPITPKIYSPADIPILYTFPLHIPSPPQYLWALPSLFTVQPACF